MGARFLERLFGAGTAGDLPRRVRAQIAADQAESEILIGWVQMVGIAFFALLYGLTRKTFPADAALEPVPFALAFYFAFTVVRLGLAHARRLPDWMVMVSILADIAVLLVTIWSFHIQYMQPPGFSLKGPTMLYLFCLIALRALRFDPRYVAMAGGAAVLGWGALVAWALAFAPQPSAVTRDYVHYLHSSDVLIGGEVDKIVSIALATAVLVLALARARRQLVRAAAEGQAAADLARFFSSEVAERITHSEELPRPGEGALREAAVLFVDLRGFTALAAELGPNRTVALLSHYQKQTVGAVEAHGGAIDKFMGDGVMATFGAASAQPGYAAQALAAALEIDSRMTDWNRRRAADGRPPLAWGMGLATGTVLFGAVGDESRLEYTVIGEAVNLAAKLEKHCRANGARLSMSEAAFALAGRQGGPVEALVLDGPARVAGLSEPCAVARLRA